MKVALVILHADPSRGGAERYTTDLATALAKGGHDVSLIATTFASVPAGVREVGLAAGGWTRTARYRRFLDALDAHVAAEPYDIVHAMLPVRRCDVYHPHAGMAVAMARKWNAIFNPRRRLMADVEQRLLTGPRPPVVIALSEYVKRSIRQHYSLSDDRLATLFNAVDLARFQPQERDQDNRPPVALMIAQDYERKGLREAILALSKLQDRPELIIVGKQPPGRYATLAAQLKVTVTFAGPTTDPRRCYASADFFVLPTKHDPCSLVVLEALAMGLPVITTVNNGASEIMADGVHGYVLKDPADLDALAQAIHLLTNSECRRVMSRACLALRPRLAYEHHLDQLQRIYDQCK